MKPFDFEQTEGVKNLTVLASLYIRGQISYLSTMYLKGNLYEAEMLLIHTRDLRATQRAVGFEYASEEDLSYWERTCVNTIEDLQGKRYDS